MANNHGVDKALVLLQSTQKSVGKALTSGYHVQTSGVTDALDDQENHKYKVLVFCTVEQSPTYVFQMPKKKGERNLAWALVSKVLPSTDQTHRCELMVEAMQHVDAWEADHVIKAFRSLADKPIPSF